MADSGNRIIGSFLKGVSSYGGLGAGDIGHHSTKSCLPEFPGHWGFVLYV